MARFFPMPLVKNLMDTMAANKLNVLHLHASDMCRFGVESKLFPVSDGPIHSAPPCGAPQCAVMH
jgi:N-acetyl-beta-hexosaminidase